MMSQNKTQASLIKELLIGFCLGTANIIPGVSGGTFLLIFDIYERVFLILNRIKKDTIFFFLICVKNLVFKANKKQSVSVLLTFFQTNDFFFLLKLITGSVTAIICLSSLMKYLILYHFSVTYALFFGLILVSIIIPVKLLTERKGYLVVFVLLGALSTIYVTYAVNPYEKTAFKSDIYKGEFIKQVKADQENTPTGQKGKKAVKSFVYSGKYSAKEYGYAALCGAVSVSAMVLPGISGSLVLILMGEYFEVVSAISGLATLALDNLVFLSIFSMGLVIGGLLFVRFISVVLKRYYNTTMAFLIGLMAGSLYALWPFKKSIIMAHQYVKKDGVILVLENARVYTNINELPNLGPELYLSIVSFIVGGIIMLFFVKNEMNK